MKMKKTQENENNCFTKSVKKQWGKKTCMQTPQNLITLAPIQQAAQSS